MALILSLMPGAILAVVVFTFESAPTFLLRVGFSAASSYHLLVAFKKVSTPERACAAMRPEFVFDSGA